MTTHRRQFAIERNTVDPEAGTFTALLFSQGEASDGHIIDIDGLEIPDRMPLFINHVADPVSQLGTLTPGDRVMQDGIPGREVHGSIETDGSGDLADIRRDVLMRMSRGQLTNFSGRWDAEDGDVVRRVNLPEDHFAHVDSKTAGYPQVGGLYFEKSVAQEGSLVGLGADPTAKLRWWEAEDVPQAARTAYRAVFAEDRKAEILRAFDAIALDSLVRIEYGDGQEFYVPQEVAEGWQARATVPEAAPVEEAKPEATAPEAEPEVAEEPPETERATVPVTPRKRLRTVGELHDAIERRLDEVFKPLDELPGRLTEQVDQMLQRSTGRRIKR